MKSKNQEIKFIFEEGVSGENFYIKSAHSNAKKLAKLFPTLPSSVVVNIFQNRSSFLRAIHKKIAPEWLIAYVPSKNASSIYILGNKEKMTQRRTMLYRQVLLHEMTHLYINSLNSNLPDWLKEGISVYVADQIFQSSIAAKDWQKITQKGMPFDHIPWQFAAEHNGYNIAGLLVMFLVRRYGWKQFVVALSRKDSVRFSIKNIVSHFGENFEGFEGEFKKQFVK